MTINLRNVLTAAALLGFFAGCAVDTVAPDAMATTPETVVLGTYEGSVDTVTGEVTLVPVGADVGGARAALLPGLDAGTYGTGLSAPAGTTDIVELGQISRVDQSAWDTVNCGAAPTAGVCVQIRARNLFTNLQIIRTYVELTTLTPTSPTTDIAARSNTTTDSDYGVSTSLGLWRYGRLNRAGVSGDSAIAYWPFVSTSVAPARFAFRATVKGQLVAPVARASTRTGTTDIAPPTYAAGTPANSTSGASRTAITSNGDYLAFQSFGTNLVSPNMPIVEGHIYRKGMTSGVTDLVDVDNAGARVTGCTSSYPSISSDGTKIAFLSTCRLVAADADALADVYVRDLTAATTTLVSVDSAGTKGNAAAANPIISPNGSFVVFESAATNVLDQFSMLSARRVIYRRSLSGSATIRVTKPSAASTAPNGDSFNPSVSSDGSLVVYDSAATNLRTPATASRQVFLYNVGTDTTTVLSISGVNGALANRGAQNAVISTDGTVVAFLSAANNLVSAPAVAVVFGVYVRTVASSASLARVSVKADGTASAGQASSPSLSSNGRYVLFLSQATDLLSVADAARADAYVYDRGTTDPLLRKVVRVSLTEAGAESASGAAIISGAAATISEDGVWAAFGFSPSLAGTGGSSQQAMRAPTY